MRTQGPLQCSHYSSPSSPAGSQGKESHRLALGTREEGRQHHTAEEPLPDRTVLSRGACVGSDAQGRTQGPLSRASFPSIRGLSSSYPQLSPAALRVRGSLLSATSNTTCLEKYKYLPNVNGSSLLLTVSHKLSFWVTQQLEGQEHPLFGRLTVQHCNLHHLVRNHTSLANCSLQPWREVPSMSPAEALGDPPKTRITSEGSKKNVLKATQNPTSQPSGSKEDMNTFFGTPSFLKIMFFHLFLNRYRLH